MSTESMISTTDHIYTFAKNKNDRGKNPLVLGFAYSLTPEGAPGLYNRILAQTIITDWVGKNPWIGVQWEISDAMDDPQLYNDLINELKQHKPQTNALIERLKSNASRSDLPPVHATPPCKPISSKRQDKDVLDWRLFRQRLQKSLDVNGDPAVAVLAKTIAGIVRQVGYTDTNDKVMLQEAICSAEQLAVYLNRLIQTEQDFHKRFWLNNEAMLELHDRQRENFGPVGFERRELPANDRSLGKYQNQRVNSLIIEAICPDSSILPKPDYLSTRGVLQHLFGEMRNSGQNFDFDRVFIYGSPVHSARCKRQFVEFAWSVGWSVDPSQVTIIYLGEDMSDCGWIWDKKTAQVWCRSKTAWLAYETNNARFR